VQQRGEVKGLKAPRWTDDPPMRIAFDIDIRAWPLKGASLSVRSPVRLIEENAMKKVSVGAAALLLAVTIGCGSDSNGSGSSRTHSLSSADVRVFISSQLYDGGDSFGGVAGADAICQDLADLAILGGSWVAWISDSSSEAREAVTQSTGQYVLLNGVVIADNFDDLTDEEIDNPINVDENLSDIVGNESAWTGTLTDGTVSSDTCLDWTSGDNSDFGLVGGAATTNAQWTGGDPPETFTSKSFCDAASSSAKHIYCFETDL
jgi:hypothetical protein